MYVILILKKYFKNIKDIWNKQGVNIMIFCLLIEVITLLFIGIDLVKMITKKSNKYFKYFEITLIGANYIKFK